MAKKKTDAEHIDALILGLGDGPPAPRLDLGDEELRALIRKAGGPRTVAAILKAKHEFPLRRIPWLFSSIDSQAVVDILHNERIAKLLASPDDDKA